MTVKTPTPKLQPGEFRAACKRPVWVPLADLRDLDPDTTRQRWNYRESRTEFLAACAFETTDPTAHAQHYAEAHRADDSRERGYGGGSRVLTQPRMRAKWRAPRPVETLHQIKALAPGSAISWEQPALHEIDPTDADAQALRATARRMVRTGTVWCKGPAPLSLWVVPANPIEVDRDGRHLREQAVLLNVRAPYDPVVVESVIVVVGPAGARGIRSSW